MNIISTQYSLSNRSLEIYLAGCKGNPHCKNCHNPESWDFSIGTDWKKSNEMVQHKFVAFTSLIKNISIFGGEPLDQPWDELERFLQFLSGSTVDIWLYTRYEAIELPDFVKKYCSYIKCGRYEEDKATEDNTKYGIKLASSNQHIYKRGLDF